MACQHPNGSLQDERGFYCVDCGAEILTITSGEHTPPYAVYGDCDRSCPFLYAVPGTVVYEGPEWRTEVVR